MSDNLDFSSRKQIGTIFYDENFNILEFTGIGESRKCDIKELSKVKLDESGYGILRDKDENILIYILKTGDGTLVTYNTM